MTKKIDFIEQFTQSLTETEKNLDFRIDLTDKKLGELVIAFHKQMASTFPDKNKASNISIQGICLEMENNNIPYLCIDFSLGEIFKDNTYHFVQIAIQKQDYNNSIPINSFFESPEEKNKVSIKDLYNKEANIKQEFYSPNLETQAESLGKTAKSLFEKFREAGVKKINADFQSVEKTALLLFPVLDVISHNLGNQVDIDLPAIILDKEEIPNTHYIFRIKTNHLDLNSSHRNKPK